MFYPLTNKAVKLLGILLITSNTYAQSKTKPVDSVLLKKKIDAVLAKHGLKSKGFVINVISTNQKGGQTAYSITNNYYQDIKVVQQPELNQWYKDFFMRHIEQVKRDSSITSNKIHIIVGSGSNAGLFVNQLKEFLLIKSNDVSIGSSFEPFTGVGVTKGLDFDNVTKSVFIYIGNLSQ